MFTNLRPILFLIAWTWLVPQMALADVQGILTRVQTQLQQLLPLAAMVALVVAGYYFFVGDAGSRQRVVRIIIGIFIGLAAVHIVTFLQGLARG
jgi:type IV secretory pathway VirB2 component (pilin)